MRMALRFFLILLTASFAVPGTKCSGGSAAVGYSEAPVSEKWNFNPGWRFLKADVEGARTVEFDDSHWEPVSAPHTFNDIDTFDDFSQGRCSGEMQQWGGKTWYRKGFEVPAEWFGRRVVIEFEAVRQVADVYCNGKKVGHCENGFVPFGADLTACLRYGAKNVIAVACDNTFVKDRDTEPKDLWHGYVGGAKFPWNNPHWHPAHGGLYRNVYLYVSGPLHFTQPLYNNLETVGTYAYATNPTAVQTGVGIEAEIANETGTPQAFTLYSRMVDREGRTVAEFSTPASLNPGERRVVQTKGTLVSPQLWEPGHPYLYRLVNEIMQNGKQVDRNEIPFGVRWAVWTRDRGFFLNDRHIKLCGWGFKSVDGWPGLGAANPDWMHDYTMKCVTDAAGNFVRWGHTAGAPVHLRSSDRLGIVTLQPGVDGEGDVKGHAWDIRLAAWRDTVVYFRNHPSLLIWEGGNQSVTEEHVRQLRAVVDQYDPHGGRVFGFRRADSVVEPYCDITISTEGSGYRADLPTVEGEYDRAESPRRVWDRQTPPYKDWHASGPYDLTSEEYAVDQLFQYKKIAAPGHSGGANWIFVDSTSGGRDTSEVTRASGELDAMRLPKEAYYVCRVLFSEKPDLHLIGHWNYPEGTVKDVLVAANCEEVALSLNGHELGRQKASKRSIPPVWKEKNDLSSLANAEHPMLFRFRDVKWQPGTLVATGFAGGKEIGRSQVFTAGPAVTLRLSPVTGPGGWNADGSDVLAVDVEAVDKDGRRCPTFEQRCDFKLDGPGIWRGGYNSGKEHSINHPWLDMECGINRVVIRSTTTPGEITLTARSLGLRSACLKIASLPFPVHGGLTRTLPLVSQQPKLGPLAPRSENPPRKNERGKGSVAHSQLFGDISYSGLSSKVQVVKAEPGASMFSDNSLRFAELPECLRGAELLQLPNADAHYSAVDLLQFECLADATLYIAHDRQLEKMDWLKNGYRDTGATISAGGQQWQLFSRRVKKGESVLIGSNSETKAGWMMMVFLSADTAGKQ